MIHISYARKGEILQELFNLLAESPDRLMIGEAIKRMPEILPPTP